MYVAHICLELFLIQSNVQAKFFFPSTYIGGRRFFRDMVEFTGNHLHRFDVSYEVFELCLPLNQGYNNNSLKKMLN